MVLVVIITFKSVFSGPFWPRTWWLHWGKQKISACLCPYGGPCCGVPCSPSPLVTPTKGPVGVRGAPWCLALGLKNVWHIPPCAEKSDPKGNILWEKRADNKEERLKQSKGKTFSRDQSYEFCHFYLESEKEEVRRKCSDLITSATRLWEYWLSSYILCALQVPFLVLMLFFLQAAYSWCHG